MAGNFMESGFGGWRGHRWMWGSADDGHGGRNAWVVDVNGFTVMEDLTVEQAQALCRQHNAAVRDSWNHAQMKEVF